MNRNRSKQDATILIIDDSAENRLLLSSQLRMDGYDILHGEDTAATHYLRGQTYSGLQQLFAPVMQSSLEKDIVAGVSAQETWSTLTTNYNTIANSPAGQWAGLTPVNTDLGDWVTRKALDGLFVKVAGEEIAIRNNIDHQVTDLLRRVFGSIGG